MPMRRKKERVVLTKMELEVMRALWQNSAQPVTVRDVLVRVNERRDKPLAYTTVQTVLMILKDKKVVEVEPGPGRAHTFRPRFSRDEVTSTMVGDLVDRLFDGRVQPLVERLMEHESMSSAELEDLKRWIELRLDDTREAR
jgi:BlaI family transcriptional regulator, penicillinase repressor